MTAEALPAPPPPLTPETLGPDPIAAFDRWFREATEQHALPFPDAACLATVDPDGWPEGRIVLLKGYDGRGFQFFTNFRSAKGRALDHTPRAALTFYWGDLSRQVRVQGSVVRLPDEESDAYFRLRPRGSQIGAWASEQSAPLASMADLEERARKLEKRWADDPIPRPPHWGGYLIQPRRVEFWQEGPDRLHHRIVFRREGEEDWAVERLNP